MATATSAIPVTVHIPLKDVPAQLTRETILAQARVTARDLARYFGIARPRLAFTGLNPHAGENGAMGREEIELIRPALDTLRAEGISAVAYWTRNCANSRPLPPAMSISPVSPSSSPRRASPPWRPPSRRT